MAVSKIRIHHTQAQQIAKTFAQQANEVRQSIQNLKSKMETLQKGDWKGDSANKFYAEMNGKVLPALNRLAAALDEASKIMLKIAAQLKQTEDEVAALFKAGAKGKLSGTINAGLGAKLSGSAKVGTKSGFWSKAGKVLGFVGDLFVGAGSEAIDMVKGIGNAVLHPIQTVKGLFHAVTHPGELWDAFKKPFVEDWESGHPGRAIGRGILFAASFLVGAGEAKAGAEAGKLGELGKAGEVAAKAGRLENGLLPWMEDLSKTIKAENPLTKPAQVTNDLNKIYEMAKVADPELRSLTERLASETGGKAGFPPGGLKSMERSMEKIAGDYAGDASKLTDVSRSKIVYNNLDDLYKGLQAVHREDVIQMFKDNIATAKPSGYRDILMNVEASNGHIGELRLHLQQIDEVAAVEHAATYKQVQAIERAAKEANRGLTAAEETQIAALRQPFQQQYADAWQKVLANSSTGAQTGGGTILGKAGQAGVAGKVINTAIESNNPLDDE